MTLGNEARPAEATAIADLGADAILDEALEVGRRILPGRALAVLTGLPGPLTVVRSFGLDDDAERGIEGWAAHAPDVRERGVALDGFGALRDSGGTPFDELRAVPLGYRDLRFGALVALAPEGGGFSERELATFELLAARVTTGLVACSLSREKRHEGPAGKEPSRTVLPGLRQLHETMDRELDRRRRYGHTPTTVLMEVEGWGEVAAVKGDVEAAALVREASDQISNFCRVSDFPFHLGDNRFALILPEAGEEGAGILCERLRHAVEALPERVTLVWGLGVAGVHGETKDALLLHADDELIAAHKSARDRITAEQRKETEIMGRVSAGLSYYQQLGVERSATQDEIRAAFRMLARHYHPDQTKMENRELAEQRFQEITRAYRVLSDPRKRAEYDGPTGPDTGHAQQTPGIDYYRALRLPRGATPAQILEAYRALAYEHRTAHRQGRTRAEERFQVVTEAYRVLADPDARMRYDRALPPEAKDRGHGLRRDTPDGVLRDVRKAREKIEGRKGEPGRDEMERLARLAESARRLIPDEPLIGRTLAGLEAALGGAPLDRAGLVALARDLETGFTG